MAKFLGQAGLNQLVKLENAKLLEKADKTSTYTKGEVNNSFILKASPRNQVLKAGYRYFNVANIIIRDTPDEILIKTKVKFISSNHMPTVKIDGYAYGQQSPISLELGWYIYANKLGYCGVVSMGAWKPIVKLCSYTENGTKYVAIALIGDIYYPQFSVEFYDAWGNDYSEGWNIIAKLSSAAGTIVPTTDLTSVPYKSTFKTTINGKYFDGLNGITLTQADVGLGSVNNTGDSYKNVLSATKLTTPRTISLSGDATGSVSFSGSSNVTIPVVVGNDTHSHGWVNITGKPSSFPATAHSHHDLYYTESEVNTKLGGKENVFTKGTAFNKNYGTVAGTTVQGNDARLSNSRPANGGNADTVGGKSVTTLFGTHHLPVWGEVSGKPTTFTPSTHSHSWSTVTSKPTTFPPATHNHDTVYVKKTDLATEQRKDYTVTLATTGWVASGGQYKQEEVVSGVVSTDLLLAGIVLSGSVATKEVQNEIWGRMEPPNSLTGKVAFTITEKPTIALTVNISKWG